MVHLFFILDSPLNGEIKNLEHRICMLRVELLPIQESSSSIYPGLGVGIA